MAMNTQKLLTLALLLFWVERTTAVSFEPLNQAIAKALGTTKAAKRSLGRELASRDQGGDVYYSKGPGGKAETLAFVQKGVYEPNCTHTWVVGVNAHSATIKTVRVVEMSCPHAFPTKAASFLDQYQGKGPAEVKSLENSVNTIAKATGSSRLTTHAVKRSILTAMKLKGKI